MIIFAIFLYLVASSCSTRPDIYIQPPNVVTVPPNCPDGQAWANGQCRDIWSVTVGPANVVTVPPNCPPGQEYVNGQCREIWFKKFINQNIFRDIQSNYADITPQNVVTVPPNCAPGQQWINGSCRDVWKIGAYSGDDTKNVVTVPPNCPPGQEYVNGMCREIWRSSLNEVKNNNNDLRNLLNGEIRQMESQDVSDLTDTNRNVISVPNQCPTGYKPDALGNCRRIF